MPELMPEVANDTFAYMRPSRKVQRGVDAVVHLAGASIGGRFTQPHKDAVLRSRLALCLATKRVLASGLDLLGIAAPDVM